MSGLQLQDEDLAFEEQFAIKASELLDKLKDKDVAGAVALIQELQRIRDESLYQEIGRLTRALHEAIKNFQIETKGASPDSEMEHASDRLAYVVEMTAKAANKTMDLVEVSMPISESISAEADELSQEWQRFLRKELKPQEFRDLTQRVAGFLENTSKSSRQLNGHLSDILLAQDFQDLTGQVINRVTDLVTDVEARLVKLVAMAGHVDQITGIEHGEIIIEKPVHDPLKGEGPQLNADEKAHVVSSQDDVDDLLSSLGF